jgi:capsular polysaccharide biosynthesis protein
MKDQGLQQTSRVPAEQDPAFLQFWHLIVRRRAWVLATLALSVLTALVAIQIIEPSWEAKAIVQVGQTGQLEPDVRPPQLIESTPRVVERLKSRSFQDGVLTSIELRADAQSNAADLFRATLRVAAIPNADLIEITVRGYSREEAKQFAEGLVTRLKAKHIELARPTVAKLEDQLSAVKRDATGVREQLEQSSRLGELSKRERGAEYVARNLLAKNVVVALEERIRTLNTKRLILEEQLSPTRTFPTDLLEPIYVPNDPVAPRKLLTLVLATVGGTLAGILLAFVIDGIRGGAPR